MAKQIFVTEFKYENVWSTEVEEAVNIYTEGKEPSISGVFAIVQYMQSWKNLGF